jgi:toxin FitB
MILLDTNVPLALMRHEPDPIVVAWLDNQPPDAIWTTTITTFEIRLGLEILADGRRRSALEEAFTRAFEDDLDNRVLPFDQAAAEAATRIAAQQRAAGRPGEIRDAQIAGITTARKATLATRNIRHLVGIGISTTNPWSE